MKKSAMEEAAEWATLGQRGSQSFNDCIEELEENLRNPRLRTYFSLVKFIECRAEVWRNIEVRNLRKEEVALAKGDERRAELRFRDAQMAHRIERELENIVERWTEELRRFEFEEQAADEEADIRRGVLR